MTTEERDYEIGVWTQAVAVAKAQLLNLIRNPGKYIEEQESLSEYVAELRLQQDEALALVKYAEQKLAILKKVTTLDFPGSFNSGTLSANWKFVDTPVPSL
jgi:hypothetical protein